MAQLVDERVTLVNTMSGETLDIEGVKAKFGVRPDQIRDYLALIGDRWNSCRAWKNVARKRQ